MQKEFKKEVKQRNRGLVNNVHLLGEILTKPILAYEECGEIFFISTIKVENIREGADEIDLLIPKEYAEGIKEGDLVEIRGKISSYRTKKPNKDRGLNICVKTRKLKKIITRPKNHINKLVIAGYVKKTNSKIISVLLSCAQVTIVVKDINKKSINITCTTWDYMVAKNISQLKKGFFVEIRGRLKSNVLPDGSVAYEVEASEVNRQ